jgi:hypothetical protein
VGQPRPAARRYCPRPRWVAPSCSAALALPRAYGTPVFGLPCLGGTRPGEEVKDGPHGDNRGGGNRCGVAPTSAPLRSRAGILQGSGLYNALGRAFLATLLGAALLCALEALRMIVNGATMTTPTQWGGHRGPAATPPCSAHRLLSWGRSSHGAQVTELRPFALPHPKHPRMLPDHPLFWRIIPGGGEILILGQRALSGWGYAELRLYGVLGSSRKAPAHLAGWWPTRSNFLPQTRRLAYCGTVATRIPLS